MQRGLERSIIHGQSLIIYPSSDSSKGKQMSNDNETPIVTPEMVDDMKTQLERIPNLRKEVIRAKSAGIDVAGQEESLVELEQRIAKFLRVYG